MIPVARRNIGQISPVGLFVSNEDYKGRISTNTEWEIFQVMTDNEI